MAEQFEFSLIFSIPAGAHDRDRLLDAVCRAGFQDAVIRTHIPRLLDVEMEASGTDAETAILAAGRSILPHLPRGSELREFYPDLVSLADVAAKLGVSRQSLQQREMPIPVARGLYRISEIAAAIDKADAPGFRKRPPKFQSDQVKKWLRAGVGARILNAKLTLKMLNPRTLQFKDTPMSTGQ